MASSARACPAVARSYCTADTHTRLGYFTCATLERQLKACCIHHLRHTRHRGIPFCTRDTVAREVTAMHAPSTVPTSALSGACVHPSVHSGVQRMTDIVANVHVRPTVDTFGDVPSPRSAAQRSCGRSRSSD